MDWVKIRDQVVAWFKKFRYPVLIILIGILLMCIPKREEQPIAEAPVEQEYAQQTSCVHTSLEEILSQIDGAGKVKVMLTVAQGEETLYQTDKDQSIGNGSESVRVETVIVNGQYRDEEGLVRQIIGPTYQGAIVVCQGADHAGVRLAVVEAVSSVTGLGADRISVLKMK